MSKKIKNIEKAAERIKKAVKNKERVILYGDSDLDGIVSVVILGEAIKTLGGSIDQVVFPNREEDGYGINLKALEYLRKYAPVAGPSAAIPATKGGLGTLLITLDLGIANVKEVEIANKMGFEVVIIDHHQILDKLPKAKIIVDPQQKGDNSPYQYLCNGGLVFKLAQELLGDNFSENLKNSFLELTALATIADMVPQIEDNKTYIENGLRSLAKTFRPGLKAFSDILNKEDTLTDTVPKIISALSAAESTGFSTGGGSVSGGKNESYQLLTNSSYQKCAEMAENLLAKAKLKQQKIKEIVNEVERRIAQKPSETIIFEGDLAWKLTLTGPVASVIAAKYQKPTFIYRKMDKESAGSVRILNDNHNSVEAMKKCSDLLMTYGGHPKASGFRIKNENLDKFKNYLIDYFKR